MALFMRTRSDRFNILIRFLRPEHQTSLDSLRAGGMSGRRRSAAEDRKLETHSFLMDLTKSPSDVIHNPPPPAHNSNDKTRPWRRQCGSNRAQIDGSTNSGLDVKMDP